MATPLGKDEDLLGTLDRLVLRLQALPGAEAPMRIHLFRWYRKWQLDIRLGEGRGYLSLGLAWRSYERGPIAYWSPDATPCHPLARGWSPL